MRGIEFLKKHEDSSIRVIFCHHSGSGASFFFPWLKELPTNIEYLAIQLPGRGSRFNEPLQKDMGTVIDSLLIDFKKLREKPFILFGHSLGGLICFELTKRLQGLSLPLPSHLIVSGCRAPHIPLRRGTLYDLPDKEFILEICRYNGIPTEILNDSDELLKIFLPILRADLQISDTYQSLEKTILSCDITALTGYNDPIVFEEDAKAWSEYTAVSFNFFSMQGDHFFINTSKGKVLGVIEKIIKKVEQ